jgi:GT2 family glycosyltransferase
MKPLAIVPTYVTKGEDVEMLHDCLKSLREAEGDRIRILVVDDGSPDADLVRAVANEAFAWNAEPHLKVNNTGFSKTVNIGLQRALDEGRDAILVNADIVAVKPFLDHMQSEGDAIVGGLLMYPSGLIQHAGIYFSLLTREFNHLYKYAPSNLREANQWRICPVTGAFQFISHDVLTRVGIYDESFKMGYEDVDYCLRAIKAGIPCVYNPKVKAIHHESMFRGRGSEKLDRWHVESWLRLVDKWRDQSFAGLVPFV